MILKKLFSTSIALLAIFACACGKTGKDKPPYTTTPNGLQYRIITKGPGTQKPKLGDYLEFHIRSHVGDSVIFDSRMMNSDEPVPFQLTESTFKGDLTEGLMLLAEGDSAQFRVSVDSLMNAGNQMLPWMETGTGMMMEYEIKVVKVFTPAQLIKHRKESAAKQLIVDDVLLKNYFTNNKLTPLKTASGLYYSITRKGTGPKPATGDSVTINYTGKLTNGNVFDSNVDPAFNHVTPLGFRLNKGQVIKGWDEGISLLSKGTVATLYIPSVYAYGAQSPGPQIPANAIMVFDVEVVEIFKK